MNQGKITTANVAKNQMASQVNATADTLLGPLVDMLNSLQIPALHFAMQ
jgi:hypothetical protein